MAQKPLITIITVSYNAAKTIKSTLESVDNQDVLCYEHLVVDGASNDDTLKIINSFDNPRRMVISEPDKGIYDAMNKGLGMAKGKYVMFLNAGDRFHNSGTLRLYEKAIKDNNLPGFIYGQTDLVDSEGKFIAKRHLTAPEKLVYKDFSEGMVVCHQAMCVLRRITPYFNLKYRYSADYEWGIICLQHSRRNVYIPEVVIDYLSEGETTRHRRASLMERFRIMSCYYGLFPTLMRHFRFVSRFFNHRKKMRQAVTGK